jgi:ATP-dependent Clp protease adaptor protein ClpS
MARTSEKFSLSYLCSRLTTIALNCLPRSSFLGRLLINRVPFHSVFLLNDDYTPMDFVVHVLEHFFDMDSETAMATMLRIHNEGAAECGFYPRPEAEQKVTEVLAFAECHRHPLQCRNAPSRHSDSTRSLVAETSR